MHLNEPTSRPGVCLCIYVHAFLHVHLSTFTCMHTASALLQLSGHFAIQAQAWFSLFSVHTDPGERAEVQQSQPQTHRLRPAGINLYIYLFISGINVYIYIIYTTPMKWLTAVSGSEHTSLDDPCDPQRNLQHLHPLRITWITLASYLTIVLCSAVPVSHLNLKFTHTYHIHARTQTHHTTGRRALRDAHRV